MNSNVTTYTAHFQDGSKKSGLSYSESQYIFQLALSSGNPCNLYPDIVKPYKPPGS